jgi:acyl dehydratase
LSEEWVDATFEAVQVGETFGPLEVEVDAQFVKLYAFSADDWSSPLSWAEGESGKGLITPASLVPALLRLYNLRYNPNTEAGLHQKEEIWMEQGLTLGTHAILNRRIVDKYTKRGKGYVVSEGEARDAGTGGLLVRHRSTEVARVPDGLELGAGTAQPGPDRRVNAIWPDGATVAAAITQDTKPGTPLVGPSKTVHQAQMSIFSNVQDFWRSIHTDRDAALRAGMPSTVAQGLMEAMYLSEMGHTLFGDRWYSDGWLSLLFVAPVFPGETVEARGLVLGTKSRGSETAFELEVWLQKSDGTKTAVGWMSATLG